MPLNGQIGQYRIAALLGEGAMGEVYKAVDTKVGDRVVALKILSERLAQSEQACARFRREVEVSANLSHPNIVTIHDRGEHEGRPYFVMEYLDGVSLVDVIRKRESRPINRRVEIAGQICDALEFAHRSGVVHRDVKPANIVVVGRAGQEQVKLLDFGIVHVEKSSLTRATTQPGTYSYMSPEQLRNAPVDARSDIFSLGIVLYELFTGDHPFDAQSDALIMTRILGEEPKSARLLAEDIPVSLDALVLKLLEKDPVQRPQSVGEVALALREILRRLTRGMTTDPSEFRNIDELKRVHVDGFITWAREKESRGELGEALSAYEAAQQLVPESDRLRRKVRDLRHRIESEKLLRQYLADARVALDALRVEEASDLAHKAWVLAPESEEVAELERRITEAAPGSFRGSASKAGAGSSSIIEIDEIVDSEKSEPEDPVLGELRAVETHLREGRLDSARQAVVEVVKRHAAHPAPQALLRRVMHVQNSGISYVEYHAAIVEGRSALAESRFADANEACARAAAIWPGDEEATLLERDVALGRQRAIAEISSSAERLLQEAQGFLNDEGAAIGKADEALRLLDEARSAGAEPKWVDPAEQRARKLRAECQQRLEEKAAQRRKVVESFLQRGRNQEQKGDSLRRQGALGPAQDELRQAKESFQKVLENEPGQAEATESALRVDATLARLAGEIEGRRRREQEVSSLMAEAQRALADAEGLSGGDEEALRSSLERIERGMVAAERAGRLGLPLPEIDGVLLDLTRLKQTVSTALASLAEAMREREERFRQAMDEGKALLVRVEKLVVGDLPELRQAEKILIGAEDAFRRALAADSSRAEASNGMLQVESYLEHFRAEIRRRQQEAEQREIEEEESRRRKRIEDLGGKVRAALARASGAREGDEESARAAAVALDEARPFLEELASVDPDAPDRGELEAGLTVLGDELRDRIERLRRDRAEQERSRAAAQEAERLAEAEKRIAERIAEARASVDRLEEAAPRAAESPEEAERAYREATAAVERIRSASADHPDAAALGKFVESLWRRAAPSVETGRRNAQLGSVREELGRARSLVSRGEARKALAILSRLDQECRPYEWLHGAMPEIRSLETDCRSSIAKSRRKLVLIAAAVAVFALVAAGVWMLLGRGSGAVPAATASAPKTTVPVRPREAESERSAGSRTPSRATPVPEPSSGRSLPPRAEPLAQTAPRTGSLPQPSATGEPSAPRPAAPRPSPPAEPSRGASPDPSAPPAKVVPPAKTPVPRIEPPVAPRPAPAAPSSPAPSPAAFYGALEIDGDRAPAGTSIRLEDLTTGQTFTAIVFGSGEYEIPVGPDMHRYRFAEVQVPGRSCAPKSPPVTFQGDRQKWNLKASCAS